MAKIFPVKIKIADEIFPVGKIACEEEKISDSPALGFRYEESWLKIGFPLGEDLPLSKNVLLPTSEKSPYLKNKESKYFGFLADHLPGIWFEGFKNPVDGRKTSRLEKFFTRKNRQSTFSALEIGDVAEEPFEPPLLTKKLASDIVRASESFFRDPERLRPEEFNLIDTLTSDLGGRSLKFLVRTEKLSSGNEAILRVRNPESTSNDALWTAVTAELAKASLINVLPYSYIPGLGTLEGRMDRKENKRLFLLSAKTLAKRASLGAKTPTWLDVADILNREGSSPKADLKELFNRLLFDVLTSNCRSTMNRIWFYRECGGWRLAPMTLPLCAAPAYPIRTLPLAITSSSPVATPEVAISVARYFGLSSREAKEAQLLVLRATSGWDKLALRFGATAREVDLMRPAFFTSA